MFSDKIFAEKNLFFIVIYSPSIFTDETKLYNSMSKKILLLLESYKKYLWTHKIENQKKMGKEKKKSAYNLITIVVSIVLHILFLLIFFF